MKKLFIPLTFISIASIVSILFTPVFAHHSDAGYDEKNILSIQGVVVRYVWRNPHVTTYVKVEQENGETVEWAIETGSTPIMSRSGWTTDMLKPGDVISVRAHPDRNPDRKFAMMISTETADGKLWIQDESDYVGSDFTTSLTGIWKGRTSTLGPFMEQLIKTPLTDAGAQAKASYNYVTDSPIAQCISPPTPRILTATAVYLTDIEILDDRVNIKNEFFDNERIVYTDGRGHPENGKRTVQGHSIGHWEDETLVVDTRLFADNRAPYSDGVPSGALKHTIERFSLIDEGKRLEIEVFLEDPEYFTESFSATLQWDFTPKLKMYRYNCDPELSASGQFSS
jgi:hypothetical protein